MIEINGDFLEAVIGFFINFFQSEGYVKGGLIILGAIFLASFALRKIKFFLFFLFIIFLAYLEYHYGFAREALRLLSDEVARTVGGG